jgi:dTDP-4-amino-4,6-dideoxy-D-glucose transaminase
MAAMIAMLRAVDVAGGLVVCPSFTFPATPHAICMAGARPLFADIDPETLTLSKEGLRQVEGYPIKAILAVDPYGICWQQKDHFSWIPILIDSAPSFGSEIDGMPAAGGRGTAQIFSFHATKPFSTMEGGALCSHDAKLMRRAAAIRNFGQDPGNGDFHDIGFNGKMLEICALIGLKQLEDWPTRAHRRMHAADRLANVLHGIEGLRVQYAPAGQRPIWTYLPVFIEPEFGRSRLAVMGGLAALGIQTRAYYWPPCHKLACYDRGETLPVTELLSSQVISLPVYDSMTNDEIDHIAQSFRQIRNG